jgi:hypothetical protein
MFVKDGLDDFRDGLPPAVEGSDFIKVHLNFSFTFVNRIEVTRNQFLELENTVTSFV